jgi:hypothetical protein
MSRYNIFLQVHKGLRAMLYQTAATLQQTDFLCTSCDNDRVMEQVIEVVDLFDKHAHTEDNFVLPAIEKHQPDVVSVFEEEHVQDHILSNRIRTLVTMFKHSFSTAEQAEIASAVRAAFVEFLVFNLSHMAKEEIVLNNLLWAHYGDEELRSISHQIVSHIQPEDMAKYSRWMLQGLNNAEIIAWLKDVRDNAPGFVFQGLLSVAEKVLPAHRWLVIRDTLADAAMVA